MKTSVAITLAIASALLSLSCSNINPISPSSSGSLPAGLIFWNKFSDAPTMTASMVGGNVTANNVTFVAGKFGQGAHFASGAGASYLRIPLWTAGSKKWGTDEVTFEFWFSTDNPTPGNDLALLFDFLEGGHPYGLRFQTWNNTTKVWVVQDTQYDISFSWDSALHHLALVVFAGSVKVYIDGTLARTVTLPGSWIGNNMPHVLHLGSQFDQSGSFQWRGIVDNLKVWNYAKTDFSDRSTE